MPGAVQIVADIGGTNARFAYVKPDSRQLLGIRVYPCADFSLLTDALNAYREQSAIRECDSICLAVAGPVTSDWIDLPNNHWQFSRVELEDSLRIPVLIINDFTAQVLCIELLSEQELRWLGSQRPQAGGAKAVLGPGTGLGISAMLASGAVLPSEGGHIAFAPVTDHEAELLALLRRRFHRVSVERVLSGQGLANLYWANCMLAGEDRELSAAEVTAGAFAGDPHCLRVVQDFLGILASTAGDTALMMGATSGVFLAGGILPRIIELIDERSFRQRFEDKGRLRAFTSGVAVAVITAEYPGLLGCAQALRTRGQDH